MSRRRDLDPRPAEDLCQGGKRALDGVSFDVPRGADLRAARPQRRRQVDADQHPRRAGHQDRRQRRRSGASTSTQHPRNAKRSIGIVPQEILFDPFFTPARGARDPGRALRRPEGASGGRWSCSRAMHLEDKANAYARTLSGGMKRRLLVAKAMVHSPPILVLDEPTAGVDIELRQQLWDYVREPQRAGRDRRADHPLSRGSRAAVRPHRDHQPRPADRQRADPRAGRHGAGEGRSR